ncbi:septum-promoting GTP-binding protein 1 [Selaginella moellendorffii]|uniref:septum-promoting GTP-binding protein 1 n=1 Tax=Selaginella moellendorffii TaxID=88036 RepID=UPI000D1C2F28|nr:septum-promoting GTP-binding protein 1 [Selaginella moellendorffii]|eukprot:XP_024514815.1 septum-promoting GTP-binding protein 1 [Selaginella moellendorffii]
MVTLARSCCAAATATTSSTIPYRRLKQLRAERQAAVAASAGAHGGNAGAGNPQVGHGEDDEDHRMRIRSLRKADRSEDAVVLKVATVGDCESGKTSFLAKYVSAGTIQGDPELEDDPESELHPHCEEDYVQTLGVALREKCLRIKNAKIVFSIWELGGDRLFEDLLPSVCEGAAAVIFMFDLTKRSTLKSVKEWFIKSRKINNCAIPVLVGSKYDQFIYFPQDIQVAITKQAMFYAETMGASLFFSSTTHNINIHKIFKIIVAKVFDLRCNISRNYNLGEPVVVY